MSSRTEQKRRLRLDREQRDRERQLAARRSRRLRLLGTALGAAAALVVIAIAVSSSNGKKNNPVKTGKVTGAAEVASRFSGIPQNGLTLGNPKAPVTFVEFADLKCPVCRAYTLSAFPTLVSRYVRTGKVKMQLELQHFVGNQNGDSEAAARMGLAAAQQNKLWQFADLFYLNQQDETTTYVTNQFLRLIGGAVDGLNVSKAMAARGAGDITSQLAQSSSEFNTGGFTGTPSFAIGRTGGTLSALNPSSFTEVSQFSGPIDKLLGDGGA